MNLLVSASPANLQCAKVIEEATQVRTSLCPDVRKAAAMARDNEYAIVIVDSAAMYEDQSFADQVFRNAPLAVAVEINTALMNSARIVSEVRSAVARVDRAKQTGFRQATRQAYNEFKGEITGISVAADLALRAAESPMFREEKLKDIDQLATRMRSRFDFQ